VRCCARRSARISPTRRTTLPPRPPKWRRTRRTSRVWASLATRIVWNGGTAEPHCIFTFFCVGIFTEAEKTEKIELGMEQFQSGAGYVGDVMCSCGPDVGTVMFYCSFSACPQCLVDLPRPSLVCPQGWFLDDQRLCLQGHQHVHGQDGQARWCQGASVGARGCRSRGCRSSLLVLSQMPQIPLV
jgi:hypothetical protein